MLCGLQRASFSAGGDMGPNRLRQTRAKAQCGTFWSRGRADERAVTFPVRILSRMTGPKDAILAEVAKVRLPVLHSGRGGVLLASFEVYWPPRSAGGGASALGGIGASPLSDH